ncbi:DUF2474 domain-containing protein [Rhizobium ruizarguesonis]|nr:DUF2474 domain-containing protein [Rhizobium ruizarguesonis]TBE87777.1 DUF2474 domain-containing protein [Rhizobium ruizarguesonis]
MAMVVMKVRQLAWMAAIWLASVLALGAVAFALREAMTLAGLRT